jgi:hypothetical protein
LSANIITPAIKYEYYLPMRGGETGPTAAAT